MSPEAREARAGKTTAAGAETGAEVRLRRALEPPAGRAAALARAALAAVPEAPGAAPPARHRRWLYAAVLTALVGAAWLAGRGPAVAPDPPAGVVFAAAVTITNAPGPVTVESPAGTYVILSGEPR